MTLAVALLVTAVQVTAGSLPIENSDAAAPAATEVAELAGIEAQIQTADNVAPLVAAAADAPVATTHAVPPSLTTITAGGPEWRANVENSTATIAFPNAPAGQTISLATSSLAGTPLVDISSDAAVTISDGVRQATDFGVATEWWQPLDGALEQGWTFSAEPTTSNGTLIIDVTVGEGATPVLISDTAARLDATDGSGSLWYRDLLAWDANEVVLPAVMSVSDNTITLTVDAAGAAYPVTVDPILTADQELAPLASSAQDRFGTAVAVDNGIAVITAPGEDVGGANAGSAQIFVPPYGLVQLQTWYAPTDLGPASGYGASADIDGNLMVIGAPDSDQFGADAGGLAVYQWNGVDSFTQLTTSFICTPTDVSAVALPCDAHVGETAYAGYQFGTSIDFVNESGIVGAPGALLEEGAAVLVDADSATDTMEVVSILNNPNAISGDRFGASVAMSADNNHVAVGAPGTNSGDGAVYVFAKGNTGDPESLYFLAETLTPTVTGGAFGTDVDFANGYLAIGAPAAAPGGLANQGQVLIYEGTTTGAPVAIAGAEGVAADARLGVSVAFAPTTTPDIAALVVGRPGLGNTGLFYTFDSSNPTLPVLTDTGGAGLGGDDVVAVATDGVNFVVGSPGHENPNVNELTLETDEGVAALGQLSGGTVLVRADNNNQLDLLGYSVDIEGDLMAVGAPGQDTAGDNAGAVYVFERTGPGAAWTLFDVIDAPVADHDFGVSVSVSGTRVAVGAPSSSDINNRVFVFEQGATEFTPVTVSPFTTLPPALNSEYGSVVELADAGNLLFVGAPGADAVYVHEFAGGVFPEAFSPTTGVGGDALASATLPGQTNVTLIIGNVAATNVESWVHIGGEGLIQSTGSNNGFSAGFGSSVAIDPLTGDYAAASNQTGEVVVVKEDVQAIRIFTPAAADYGSGYPASSRVIDIEGGTLALGSPVNGGEVQLYTYDLTAAGIESLDPSYDQVQLTSRVVGDDVGFSVAIQGTELLIGAPGDEASAGRVFSIDPIPAPSDINLTTAILGSGDVQYNTPLANFDVEITNTGSTDDPSPLALTVRYSTDAVFDANDIQLLNGENIDVSSLSLPANNTAVFNLAGVQFDPSLGIVADGPGFLVASIDSGNDIAETDETDNTASLAIVFGADDPSLTLQFGVAPGEPTSVSVAGGVAAADFDAGVIADAADDGTSLAATPLSAVPLSATPLSATTIGQTPLSAVVLNSAPLSATSLVDVGIEGGWEAIVAGTPLANVPLVDLTLGDIVSAGPATDLSTPAGRLAASPLSAVSVFGSPLSAVPLSAVVLGALPLSAVPLSATSAPTSADEWCNLLNTYTDIFCSGPTSAAVTATSLMEATLRGLPLSAVPLSATPLSAVPLSATPLSATTMGQINLAGTPLSAVPLSAVPLSATPLSATPLSATPLSAVVLLEVDAAGTPLSATPLSAVPLSAVPLSAVDVGGTPLSAVPLSAVPLSAVPLSATPLSATPLSATPLSATPLSAVPLSAVVLADAPLSAVPLSATATVGAANDADWCHVLADIGNGYDCANGVDLNTTTIFSLALAGVPLSAVPLSATPLSATPLSAVPLSAVPLSAVPLSAVPLSAVPLSAVDLGAAPLSATPLSAVPLSSTLLSDVPLSAVDILGSPLSAVPLSAVPLSATPLSAVPLSAVPLSSVPLSAVPLSATGVPLDGLTLAGTPLSAVPLSAVDIGDTPLSAVPLSAVPLSAVPLSAVGIDCDLVDCDIDTIGDAVAAGAIDLNTTFETIFPLLEGISAGDIADHLIGFTAADLVFNPALTLGNLTNLDNMVLGDIPSDLSELGLTTLEDIEAGLYAVEYADLIGAIIDPATGQPFPDADAEQNLREALDLLGLNAGQMEVLGAVTLGDFIDAGTPTLTMEDLGTMLGLVRVDDVLAAFDPDASLIPPLQIQLGDLTVNELQGLTLGDLIGLGAFDNLTIDQVFSALSNAGLLDGFTLGDLLLTIVGEGEWPFGGLDFTEVNVGELPEGIVPDVGFFAQFEVQNSFTDQTVEVTVELPATAAYIGGSSTLGVETIGSTPVPLEPLVDGNTLTWTISGAENGVLTFVEFDVRPQVSLGDTSLQATARILGLDERIQSTALVSVAEGNEPNDFPAVTTATGDTIYLTYIQTETDNDVFAITVAENDQLAIQLSGLSADLDVALYADPSDAAVGTALTPESDLDPLIPIEDPDQNGADAEPLQDFRRLDFEDSNLGLLEVSNSAGTETEVIVTDRLDAGTYYIQVFGANGATNVEPAALQINVIESEVRPPCSTIGSLGLPSASIQSAPPALAGSLANTALLVNYERFEQLYSLTERNDLETSLDAFVSYLQNDAVGSTLGIDPIVIPVEGFGAVQSAYDAWDNDAACDPETANAVVNQIISNAIEPLRDQLSHIVIVGGDDIIPMARLIDETTIANEYDFRHEFTGVSGIGSPGSVNSFSAAPWERRYLSDEPFGESEARDLGGRFLYVSDIALGRLVESPQQITSSLTHFQTFNGSLDIQTGQVLGYDFLSDGSAEVAADLGTALTVDDELSDGFDAGGVAWDATDGASALTSGTDVVSLNAHFDHYRALPAEGDQVVGFNDNLEASNVLGSVNVDVVFSMGCHGGLSVSDLLISTTNQDWAETFATSNAVFVGNTGFGYGDTESVAYSERLMALFAEEMVMPLMVDGPGSSSTIGQALIYAKNRYFSDNAVFSVYDEKALMEATFYGLPFYQVGLAPAPLPVEPTNVTVPDTTGLDALAISADATNDPQVAATGIGNYFSNPDQNGDPQVISVPGYPLQPSLTNDVSVVDSANSTELAEVAHGAIVVAMDSVYSPAGFDPVIADAVFNESGEEPPVGNVVFPAKPVTINTATTPSGERQSLVVATGQYSSDPSVQRTDDNIDVLVYYSDPAETDFNPPTIGVVDSTLEGGTFTVTLDVNDLDNAVNRVYLLIAEDPAPGATLTWVGIDLQLNGSLWAGSLETTASEVEFLVQAVDAAGNVGFATNKARNFNDDGTVDVPPVTPDLTVGETGTNLDAATGWYVGTATVQVTTTDPGGATYSVDGGAVQPLPTGTSTFDINGDGLHSWAVETAGGDQVASGQVLIDTGGNTVASLASPANGASYSEGETVPLLFSCEDPSLQTCVITLDGNVFTGGVTDLPTSPGSFTVSVTATDVFGNTAAAGPNTYTVTPLALTATESSTTPAVGGIYTDSVTVTVSTDDPAGAEYQVDGGGYLPIADGASFVISGDGPHSWDVRSISSTATAAGAFTIDTTAPTVTITSPLDGDQFGVGAAPNVGFACTDANLATCLATVDTVPISDGDLLPSTTVGTYVLSVIGTDAGGLSTTETISYEITAASNPPVVVSSTVSGPADPSTPTNVAVTFTGDAGTVMVIDWGDGTSCTTPGSFDCSVTDPSGSTDQTGAGSHIYANSGPFTITVTLTSPSGASTVVTVVTTACTITGTNGNDRLWGTNGDDVICGLGGHDRIYSHSGDDQIWGGAGNDTIASGLGADTVYGGAGRDRIWAGSGNDTVFGESGRDRLYGAWGDDMLDGGDGVDVIYGQRGNDILVGGPARDWISGSWGDDDLFGNGGNDYLRGDGGNDDLDGGPNRDRCVGGWYSGNSSAGDTKVNCET